MNKFTKKLLVALVAVAAAVCMSVSLVACGGAAAQTTGYYTANKEIRYTNFQPTYNYFYFVITQQSIETFDDDTYCLTVNGVMYSNVKFGADVPSGEFTANEQGHVTTRYYGTFTETEKTDDDVTLVLSKPTRVTHANKGALLIDTANWTDKMSEAVTGEGEEAVTADAYLTSRVKDVFTDSGLEVYVMFSSYSFASISGLVLSHL